MSPPPDVSGGGGQASQAGDAVLLGSDGMIPAQFYNAGSGGTARNVIAGDFDAATIISWISDASVGDRFHIDGYAGTTGHFVETGSFTVTEADGTRVDMVGFGTGTVTGLVSPNSYGDHVPIRRLSLMPSSEMVVFDAEFCIPSVVTDTHGNFKLYDYSGMLIQVSATHVVIETWS